LIAHELAHVVQQGGELAGGRPIGVELPANSRSERAAEAAADGFAAGQSLSVPENAPAMGLQRMSESSQGNKINPDPCWPFEQDPERLSKETAKHFLDDVEPGAKKRSVKTADCKANVNNPDRIECDVTFDDGVVRLSFHLRRRAAAVPEERLLGRL
jgi:hypothetical protein